jgi:SAM-dependent methyltransferase
MSSATADFDALASAYDAWFEGKGKLIFEIEVKAFEEALPLLPKPWLEVGVGSGRFAQRLGIATGVDPSAKLLESARSRGIATFLARGEDQVFKAGSFGTVFLIVTLCFVQSPSAVIQEVNRVLKRNGKTVLGLVLRDSPWGRFYLAEARESHRFYKHATFYSYEEVISLLESAGLMVESTVSTLFQKPGEVSRIEEPKAGFYPDAGFTILVCGRETDRQAESEWAA